MIKKGYWMTKEGVSVRISKMSILHIENTIRYLERRIDDLYNNSPYTVQSAMINSIVCGHLKSKIEEFKEEILNRNNLSNLKSYTVDAYAFWGEKKSCNFMAKDKCEAIDKMKKHLQETGNNCYWKRYTMFFAEELYKNNETRPLTYNEALDGLCNARTKEEISYYHDAMKKAVKKAMEEATKRVNDKWGCK